MRWFIFLSMYSMLWGMQRDPLDNVIERLGQEVEQKVHASRRPCCCNKSLMFGIEGAAWIVFGLGITGVTLGLQIADIMEVDSASILLEITGLTGAGWGIKQLLNAIRNEYAKDDAHNTLKDYGLLLTAQQKKRKYCIPLEELEAPPNNDTDV